MSDNKDFIEEQEDIMAEVREHNKKYNEYIQELEQEMIDGGKEMEEYNKNLNQKETITSSNKKVKETGIAKEITTATKPTAEQIKPPMNAHNIVEQKAEITKRKNAVKYLASANESITKTLNISGRQKLKWSKEEIILMQRVRAISKELGAIIDKLKIIPEQQEGMTEIKQQLAEQPVANVTVEYATSGNFSVIQADTGVTIATGSKEEIKGFFKGYIAQQTIAGKTE